jgi:hypothetical protein
MRLQYKKVQLYATDLSQFESDRNPLSSAVFVLSHKESMAMEALLSNWIEARQDDNYKLSKVDFCINIDEAKELIEKLKSQISYEKC